MRYKKPKKMLLFLPKKERRNSKICSKIAVKKMACIQDTSRVSHPSAVAPPALWLSFNVLHPSPYHVSRISISISINQ
jgi:hypothetical protein